MTIKSLQLCNFRQYKGEQPPIVFSIDADKNVTIILGVNTSGKTTLIQAFRWCLYGDCSYNKRELLNAEVEEHMSVSERRQVYVEITLSYKGTDYIIRREQEFQMTEKHTLKPLEPTLKVQYREDNGEQQPVTFVERQNTIEKILPMALSGYFFFDGEGISDINKGDVVAAVRGLMDIDVLGEARDHLDPNSSSSVTSKLEKELDVGTDSRSQRLKTSLETAKQTRENLIAQRDTAREELSFFEQRKEELAGQLRENQKAKDLQKRRESIDRDVKKAEDDISKAEGRIKSSFSKGALQFFAQPLIDRALAVMDNSSEDEEGIKEMRQGAIDHILERGRCICGCELSENEGAKRRIMHERSLLPPETIGTTIRHLRENLQMFRMNANGFNETMRENHVDYKGNLNFIDEKREELKEVSDEITRSGNVDVQRIEDDFIKNEGFLKGKKHDCETLTARIGEVEGEIKRLEKAIEGLAISSSKNRRIQRCIAYARAAFEWFDHEYQKKEALVKERLLESVNRIFEQMYHGQRRITISDKYQITLLAQLESSAKSTDESKGLEAVKNFSFITGLVDLARQKLRSDNGNEGSDSELEMQVEDGTEPYPLVMDAPFSNADEIHIGRIAQIVPSVAEQVILIVMNKDWEFAKATMGARVGRSYMIEKVNNSETNSVIRGGEANV